MGTKLNLVLSTKLNLVLSSKEAVWLQRLCSKIGLKQNVGRLDSSNQSEIFLAKNLAYHSKRKHIDVEYHFVTHMVGNMKMLLENVDTLKNSAELLKKFVSIEKFTWCKEAMGLDALVQ